MKKLITILLLASLIFSYPISSEAIDNSVLKKDIEIVYQDDENVGKIFAFTVRILHELDNDCEYLTDSTVLKEIRDTVKYNAWIKNRVPLDQLFGYYRGYKEEECTGRFRFFSFYDYLLYQLKIMGE